MDTPPPPHVSVVIQGAQTMEETWPRVETAIKGAVPKLKPGAWLVIDVNGYPGISMQGFWRMATRQKLDQLSPKNPLAVDMGVTGILNSLGFQEMDKIYPGVEEFNNAAYGAIVDPPASYRGRIGVPLLTALWWQHWYPQKESLDKIAEMVRRNLEIAASAGITTFSTRVPAPTILSTFSLLNRKGQMPIRLAALHETHYVPVLSTMYDKKHFFTQNGSFLGVGGDYLWFSGVAAELWDTIYPEACLGPDILAPPEIKRRELCPKVGGLFWDVLKNATKAGWRPAGVHGVGSHGVRLFIQMLEELRKETGMTAEDIRKLRPTVEHASVMGTPPDVVQKLKEYGIIVSAGPMFFYEAPYWIRDYGPEIEKFVLPIRSLLDSGVKVVGQFHGYKSLGKYFWLFITRKMGDKVIGPQEKLDRVRVMKMFTRWAGEYVLRENALGSLEKDKLADVLVLDKDYFTIPVDDIPTIRPMMTLVGGKTMFMQKDFAAEQSMQAVGYQPKTDRPWQ